jgi:hypothetical protein
MTDVFSGLTGLLGALGDWEAAFSARGHGVGRRQRDRASPSDVMLPNTRVLSPSNFHLRLFIT